MKKSWSYDSSFTDLHYSFNAFTDSPYDLNESSNLNYLTADFNDSPNDLNSLSDDLNHLPKDSAIVPIDFAAWAFSFQD